MDKLFGQGCSADGTSGAANPLQSLVNRVLNVQECTPEQRNRTMSAIQRNPLIQGHLEGLYRSSTFHPSVAHEDPLVRQFISEFQQTSGISDGLQARGSALPSSTMRINKDTDEALWVQVSEKERLRKEKTELDKAVASLEDLLDDGDHHAAAIYAVENSAYNKRATAYLEAASKYLEKYEGNNIGKRIEKEYSDITEEFYLFPNSELYEDRLSQMYEISNTLDGFEKINIALRKLIERSSKVENPSYKLLEATQDARESMEENNQEMKKLRKSYYTLETMVADMEMPSDYQERKRDRKYKNEEAMNALILKYRRTVDSILFPVKRMSARLFGRRSSRRRRSSKRKVRRGRGSRR